MSRAEEFIKSKIRIGSNISSNGWRRKGVFIPSYSLPWLTPDDARKAVEIARQEVINDACDWLEKHSMKYFLDGRKFLGSDEMVKDFRQVMEDWK